MVCNDEVSMTPVYKSGQMITCSVGLKDEMEEFFCSFVYALNTMEERKELWEDMRNHFNAPLFKNKKNHYNKYRY